MTLISTLLTKLAVALTSLAVMLGLAHSPIAATATITPVASTTNPTMNAVLANTSVSSSGVFTDKNWSLTFAVQPEWKTNEILGANNTLHQLQLSGMKQVVFISKDEAIGLSSDLPQLTATRTIDGKSVEVTTYTNPNATYAYYQTFSLKEADGTYNFLLKSTVADPAVTDAFIKSIAKK